MIKRWHMIGSLPEIPLRGEQTSNTMKVQVRGFIG